MPHVIAWQRSEWNVVIDRALWILGEGGWVALPTESGYDVACSALHAESVARLAQWGRAGATAPGNLSAGGLGPSDPALGLAVALSAFGQLLDWVPAISSLGLRLARRAWPGPLLLINGEGQGAARAQLLPADTRIHLPERLLFRCPDHEAARTLLAYCPEPLVAARAPTAQSATQLAQALGEQLLGDGIALVIDAGEEVGRSSPTVVEVEGKTWHIRQEGEYSAAKLAELARCRILFVCTGNTCRSPLAEVLCAKLLAERLGCTVAQLPEHGYMIGSAGLAAWPGGPAAAEAVAVAHELGADLSAHQSQTLTLELLVHADHIIAMTHGHLYALSAYNIRGAAPPRLLASDGVDIADPIGAGVEVYRECAQQILLHLQQLVPELACA